MLFDAPANFTNSTVVAEIDKPAMCVDALFDNIVNHNWVVYWQEFGMNELQQSDRRFVDGAKGDVPSQPGSSPSETAI
jgi:hypothetical protein